MRFKNILYIFLIFIITLTACYSEKKLDKKDGKLNIVCTTAMVADLVKNITNEKANVIALMGPGVDPHLYKATQGDLQKLSDANIIFYNGLHLEGKMQDIFEKMKKNKPVMAIADGLPKDRLLQSVDYADAFDPHIWFDTDLWSKTLNDISTFLSKHDIINSGYYLKKARNYEIVLNKVHNDNKRLINLIPKENRVLITSHDAFRYFGRAYNMEVKGLQGLSTASEFGLRDVSDLVNYIVGRKIKSVFIESSVPRKPLEAVVEGCKKRGHNLVIGGELFSDAMGEEGTKEGTYIGMVSHNVNTIVNALK